MNEIELHKWKWLLDIKMHDSEAYKDILKNLEEMGKDLIALQNRVTGNTDEKD